MRQLDVASKTIGQSRCASSVCNMNVPAAVIACTFSMTVKLATGM